MDFYLSVDTTRIQFPLTPEKVTAQTSAKIETFNVIELGEIGLPRGKNMAHISMQGFFPGAARKDMPFVKNWTDPREIVDQIVRWRDDGKKVRLLVTETPLNLDVFISTFQHEYSGGHGDISYSLELVEARALAVYTTDEATPSDSQSVVSNTRPAPGVPRTYTVASGDFLYAIAKKTLGDGSRYADIYALNKDVIGPDINLIQPGQVLRIPGGSAIA